MAKLVTLIALAYAVAAAAALLLGFAATFGWFGIKGDALAMVFAMLAALPWSFAVGLLPADNMVAAVLVIVFGMAINLALLLAVARALRR
jgi:hypothetical protein